jgi:hypothetical protein
MKLISLLSFLTLIITKSFCYSQDYLNPYNGFTKGDTVYAFADKIPMYSGPNTMSKLITEIRLNQVITIASEREQDFSIEYNSNEFIHVNLNGKKGFIQRKHLAAKQLIHTPSKTIMLFQFEIDSEHQYKLRYSEYCRNELVLTKALPMFSNACNVYLEDIHGLDSVTAFLVVDHFAEACGVNGGLDYYVWNPGELSVMATLFEVGDGGVYSLNERLIFPTDPEGLPDKVLFESVEENVYDEETEWVSTLNTRRVYQWVYGNLYPEFKKSFEEEENED